MGVAGVGDAGEPVGEAEVGPGLAEARPDAEGELVGGVIALVGQELGLGAGVEVAGLGVQAADKAGIFAGVQLAGEAEGLRGGAGREEEGGEARGEGRSGAHPPMLGAGAGRCNPAGGASGFPPSARRGLRRIRDARPMHKPCTNHAPVPREGSGQTAGPGG